MGFELDWHKDFGLDWECHCREGWLGYGTRRADWVWYKEGWLEYGAGMVRIWVLYTLFTYVQHVTRL